MLSPRGGAGVGNRDGELALGGAGEVAPVGGDGRVECVGAEGEGAVV